MRAVPAVLLLCSLVACSDGASDLAEAGPGCNIPTADYGFTLTPEGGDCPAEISDALPELLSQQGKADVAAGGSCRVIAGAVVVSGTAHDCELQLVITSPGSETGLAPGTAVLSADCADGLFCTYTYGVEFSSP